MTAAARAPVDAITLTVVWNKLISIADEMGGALRRTAFSEAVREGEDFSTGLFDRTGRLVAQGNFTPGHLGAMPYVVRHLLDSFPAETLRPGDTVVTNDPFLGGGHFPDFFMMTPVFRGEILIGFVVNTAHHVDVGGAFPGSQAVQGVTEAFQEGIRVLPVKICQNGEFDPDLLRLILGNVRVPNKMLGDLRAQQNANFVGSSRLVQLFEELGEDSVEAVIEALIERSEARTRELISALPDGTYSFEDHLDDVGPQTEPVRVVVDVTINDDHATVDFSRSSDQVAAGINCYINYTRAYAMFAMRIFAAVDVPHNAGVEKAVSIVAREGCFFNARYPAACGGRATVQIRIFDAVNGAMAQARPDRAMAAFTHWSNPNFGGTVRADGSRWVMYDLMFGGYGGRAEADGAEAMCPVMNCANIPVEIHETTNPVLVHRLELIPDSGGPGEFRGGCALRKDVELLDDAVVSLLGDRHKFPPYGLLGGQPGRVAQTVLVRDGAEHALGSKEVTALQRGDILSFRLAGAGGYGDPLKRSKDAIRRDLRQGFVTEEGARNDYGFEADAGSPATGTRSA